VLLVGVGITTGVVITACVGGVHAKRVVGYMRFKCNIVQVAVNTWELASGVKNARMCQLKETARRAPVPRITAAFGRAKDQRHRLPADCINVWHSGTSKRLASVKERNQFIFEPNCNVQSYIFMAHLQATNKIEEGLSSLVERPTFEQNQKDPQPATASASPNIWSHALRTFLKVNSFMHI
jgi:hypothetical protein